MNRGNVRLVLWRFALCLCAGLAGTMAAQGQTRSLAPGEYIMREGWGHLNIEGAPGAAQKFSIESVNSDGNTCSVKGGLRGVRGVVPMEEGQHETPCEVEFAPKGAAIEVAPRGACYIYCGMHASFDGEYLTPAAGCSFAEMGLTRRRFQEAFSRKDYAGARAILAPVLTTCADTLSELDEMSLRNDLARTLHQLGQDAQCRAMLEPLRGLAGMSKEELEAGYAPVAAQVRMPIAQDARTNLRLCKGK